MSCRLPNYVFEYRTEPSTLCHDEYSELANENCNYHKKKLGMSVQLYNEITGTAKEVIVCLRIFTDAMRVIITSFLMVWLTVHECNFVGMYVQKQHTTLTRKRRTRRAKREKKKK